MKFSAIKSLLIIFICSYLGACSSTSGPMRSSNGNYVVKSRIWTQSGYDTAKRNSYAEANKLCTQMKRSMEALRAGDTYDNGGWIYLLEFSCYDPVERARLAKIEADRQRAIKAEQDRLAEIERQRLEAERQRQEAERLRQEAEWERTRPQREAAARKAEADERARLNSICPLYAIVRFTCASSNSYQSCMQLRYGKNYSFTDDQTCYRR